MVPIYPQHLNLRLLIQHIECHRKPYYFQVGWFFECPIPQLTIIKQKLEGSAPIIGQFVKVMYNICIL